MPRLGITYNAVGYFGWLQVGDIIELTDTDIRARLAEEKYHAMLDDLTPPGFIDDGQSDEVLSIERGRADAGFWSSGL